MSGSSRAGSGHTEALAPIVGQSAGILRAVSLVERFAPTGAPILLVGDTGTGKELFARHIHALSGRTGELVDINCGTLPKELVESTLFGHRRGSFSGALETTVGLVAAADGGTLFLDELCSLSPQAQVKLLRVLETGAVRRIGDTSSRRVDFRLIAASQESLESRVGDGQFRLDLLHRIAGVVIELPPLGQRGTDVLLLADQCALTAGMTLSPDARQALLRHSWPGNVRELRAALARADWLCDRKNVSGACMTEAIALGAVGGAAAPRLDERSALLQVCETHGWHAGRAATTLGLSRTTLYRRLRDSGVSLRDRKRLFRITIARGR